jgi:FkbM family methyltransferase
MASFAQRIAARLCSIYVVARALGADRASQAKLLAAGLWMLVNDTWKAGLRVDVRLRFAGRTFPFRLADVGDYELLEEVFLDGEYAVDLPAPPRVVLDLGSNVGASALYFALRYPHAVVHAVEPDPANLRRLRRHAAAFARLHVHPVAAWSHGGTLPFFADPHRGTSSSVFARTPRQQRVQVPARTLDALLDAAAPLGASGAGEVDVLKFDIEGAEVEVLGAATGLARVRTLVGEVHDDIGTGDLARVRACLAATHAVSVRRLGPARHLLVARRRPPEEHRA